MSALPNGYHQAFNDHDEIETTYTGQAIKTTFSPLEADRIVMWHAANRAEAAEREATELRADKAALEQSVRELTAERDTDKKLSQGLFDMAANKIMELREQLEHAQERIVELEGYINKHNQRVLSAFERTATLDWRPATTDEWIDETPLGHAIEESGEVEE